MLDFQKCWWHAAYLQCEHIERIDSYNPGLALSKIKVLLKSSSLHNLGALFHTPTENIFKVHKRHIKTMITRVVPSKNILYIHCCCNCNI